MFYTGLRQLNRFIKRRDHHYRLASLYRNNPRGYNIYLETLYARMAGLLVEQRMVFCRRASSLLKYSLRL